MGQPTYIYHIGLDIKGTTYAVMPASCLDLHLEISCGEEQHNTTKGMISIFPDRTFHLYVTTFERYLYTKYISLS